jgi:hypothetical protein
MSGPFSKYHGVKFLPQRTQEQIDKEARNLAFKEKKDAETAKKKLVAAEKKRLADKLRYPDNYSDSDDDVGLLDQKIEPGVKIDETYWAESSVEPPPIGPRLFDDKIGPVYPSYIGKDGKVRADDVAPPNWLKEQNGANKSKRRRKSNRRVGTRKSKRGRTTKSKRGRTTKSKRGIKSKRTRS